MRERMRELDIRMSELARYTGVSRPTLYKYVESYENKAYKDVPDRFLRTFRYIDRNRSVTKEQAIVYTITEFADGDSRDTKETIRKYIASKGGYDPKIRLMYALVTTDLFDDVVPYLTGCAEIHSEGRDDEEAIAQIARYLVFRDDVRKNAVVSREDMERIRNEMGRE